jgi:hypothetical protein
MSPEEDALATVVATLRRLSIPFMLTGSVASSDHGHPRATHDADLVIDHEHHSVRGASWSWTAL